MSVLIFGSRCYGTVDAYGGEHAATRFAHVWFVPLFPLGSMWMSDDDSLGFPIKLHGRSVAACYLRVWGVPLALGGLLLGLRGELLGALVGVIATALVAWSWTWHNLRRDGVRRSDFNLVAFGTRCEPRRMKEHMRERIRGRLDEAWDRRKPDRSPNDVAQHGTADATEAVLAYGLLRLAAATRRGAEAHAADADADRILAGAHAPAEALDGPYRAAPPVDHMSTASLDRLVAAAKNHGQLPISAAMLRKQRRWAWVKLIGLILFTPGMLSGIGIAHKAVQSPLDVGPAELDSRPPVGRMVRVACDDVSDTVWHETGHRGRLKYRFAICTLGQRTLPVRFDLEDRSLAPGRVIVGELRDIPSSTAWVNDGLRMNGDIYARSLVVYVDATTSPTEQLLLGVFGAIMALAAPALWILWFRARARRKKRELALAMPMAAPR